MVNTAQTFLRRNIPYVAAAECRRTDTAYLSYPMLRFPLQQKLFTGASDVPRTPSWKPLAPSYGEHPALEAGALVVISP